MSLFFDTRVEQTIYEEIKAKDHLFEDLPFNEYINSTRNIKPSMFNFLQMPTLEPSVAYFAIVPTLEPSVADLGILSEGFLNFFMSQHIYKRAVEESTNSTDNIKNPLSYEALLNTLMLQRLSSCLLRISAEFSLENMYYKNRPLRSYRVDEKITPRPFIPLNYRKLDKPTA